VTSGTSDQIEALEARLRQLQAAGARKDAMVKEMREKLEQASGGWENKRQIDWSPEGWISLRLDR